MDQAKILATLDTEFACDDLGCDLTARQYLKELLLTLLSEGESFNGKRPFGNSGWKSDLAIPLILAGAISGTIEDGYPEFDQGEYWQALEALVAAL